MAGYNRKERWTAKQIQFIKENYSTMKDEQMAVVLGRTLKSVRHKRARLELDKASAGKGVLMTKEQHDAILQDRATFNNNQ